MKKERIPQANNEKESLKNINIAIKKCNEGLSLIKIGYYRGGGSDISDAINLFTRFNACGVQKNIVSLISNQALHDLVSKFFARLEHLKDTLQRNTSDTDFGPKNENGKKEVEQAAKEIGDMMLGLEISVGRTLLKENAQKRK